MNHPPETSLPPDEPTDDVIGRAFRISLAVAGVLLLFGVAAGGAYWYLQSLPESVPETEPAPLPAMRERAAVALPRILFTDITKESGVDFVHENGAAGEKLLPETMGGGCGFLDFDGDGDQDILLVNSQRWPWDETPSDAAPATRTQKLYANDGRGRFSDVTSEAGLDASLYGMGCAFGDYDGDGDPDVYLTAVGPNRMFRNDGGRFTDVTDETGLAGPPRAYSSSAGWFDYDNDGDLDLFVCNYIVWSREYDVSQNFQLTGGGRAYGRPQDFAGTFSMLFRNDGGRFTDVSAEAGIEIENPATGRPMGKSLGVTFADFDADGRLDIFVANDTVQNYLFHNRGGGRFEEVGTLSGVAFDIAGNARGAMGVDVARFRDGKAVGIAVGNFANEMTALYVSPPGAARFTDEAVSNGLGPQTRLDLTFGTCFFDADLDGRLDLLAANGHLEEDIHRVQPSQHYEQPPRLFWNAGPERSTEFVPLGAEQLGDAFLRPMVGRGASYADIDADGDLDVLLTASGGRCRLLRNDLPSEGRHWIRFRLVGTASNRDAVGATVMLVTSTGRQYRTVMPTCSYLAQVELPVTFGLGEAQRVERAEITWPSGATSVIENPPIDRLHVIREDAAKATD